MKNYYQILELEAFSDIESVKSAFRRLARQYHPDLCPGDKSAEEKFKQINEANEILSSPEKKAFYDESLRATQRQKESGGAGNQKASQSAYKSASTQSGKGAKGSGTGGSKDGKSTQGGSSTPINELFESFLKKGFQKEGDGKGKSDGPRFRPKSDAPKRGADVTVEASITPQEAKDGVVKTVNVQHNELCRRCSGTGKVSGKVCTACQGERVVVRLKKIDVRIPAGVKTGSKVRVAGEGGRGDHGGEHGDLFLQIQVQVDPTLRIEGLDVHGELSITPPEAVLGADVQVPTMHGMLKMTIPPFTSSGRVFRLKDQGVHNGAAKGDHYVTVKIVSPDKLSPREQELYQELSRLRRPE